MCVGLPVMELPSHLKSDTTVLCQTWKLQMLAISRYVPPFLLITRSGEQCSSSHKIR